MIIFQFAIKKPDSLKCDPSAHHTGDYTGTPANTEESVPLSLKPLSPCIFIFEHVHGLHTASKATRMCRYTSWDYPIFRGLTTMMVMKLQFALEGKDDRNQGET